MGLHFSCNNKNCFSKEHGLGCFPFLCLMGLNRDAQRTLLSAPDEQRGLPSEAAGTFHV